MLTPLPEPAGSPLFKNEAGCEEWLKQLQLTNLQRAQSLLLAQLNELNRCPMPGLERLNILERMRETIHHVQSDYSKKLIAKPLPLNQSELSVFAAIVQLWQSLVSGYQRCLQDYMNGDSQLVQHGALLCHRCLLYGGLAIFEHLRTGYEFDEKLWQQLHNSYSFAEQQKLQREAVSDKLNGVQPHSCCHDLYIKILLACYARPAELNRAQLLQLDNWLAQWSSSVSLENFYTTSKGDAHPLALDLGGSHGLRPVKLYARTAHTSSMRYLAMVPLSKLLRVKTILLQQGKTPQQLELGDLSREDCIEFLTFLHQCWCENLNTRSDERSPASKKVQLCCTTENIHSQMSGKAPGETAAQVEEWLVLNESLMGTQLTCEDTPRGRWSHNQLVGLYLPDAATFVLGKTAWVNVTHTGLLRIGVRYFPGTPLAVELHTSGADTPESGENFPALLLQAAPAFNTPPSLIIPRKWFKAGRIVDIRHQNGEMQPAKMGFSVERGTDFERVSFTLT